MTNAVVSDINLQQDFISQPDRNVDQQKVSTRPYDEKQTSAGSQDLNGDNLSQQPSANRAYQTTTQRSQNSYSQQDYDQAKAEGRPVVPNNSYGNTNSYNKNNVNLVPEGAPTAESETDNGNRGNIGTTEKWSSQYSTSTQQYASSKPTQSWKNPQPTVPRRPAGVPAYNSPPKQPPHFDLDPNPILSPVDRVPIMIEYPKIDYDKVECE